MPDFTRGGSPTGAGTGTGAGARGIPTGPRPGSTAVRGPGTFGPEGPSSTIPIAFDALGEHALDLLAQAGVGSIAPRSAAIQENLLRAQRLAGGSIREVTAQFGEQIRQLQGQLLGESQRLGRLGGFNLGGQREQLETQLLAQSAGNLQDVLTQGVITGRDALVRGAAEPRPLLATQIPAPVESVETSPFSLEQAGGAVLSIANALDQLLRNNRSPGLTAHNNALQLGLSHLNTLQQPSFGGFPARTTVPPPPQSQQSQRPLGFGPDDVQQVR